MDSASHSVHYTLLIACVLVAFVLGAFLSAFVVSCYCSHSAHRRAHRQLDKDPETPLPHALSLRSLAKLNGLLDTPTGGGGGGSKLDSKMDLVSSPKVYNSYIPNGCKEHCTPTVSHGTPGAESRDLSLQQGEDLSGLPTPDSTPELPIKSMKAFRNQWERNQNCNNAKEPNMAVALASSLGSGTSSRPCSGGLGSAQHQQHPPYAHSLPNGHGPSLSLHLPEERKIPNDERAAMAGASAPSPAQPYSLGPQSVVDVSTLDELLRHIQEANASGAGGGLAVLTSALLPGAASPHPHPQPPLPLHPSSSQQCIPEAETAAYYSSSTLPRDGMTRRLDVPPEALVGSRGLPPLQLQHQHSQQQQQQFQQQQFQQLQPVPERSVSVSVSRQPSQRQSLIRMGSSAGAGAIPRQRGSMSQWPPGAQQRLVRVSSGSGGGGYEISEVGRPLIPGAGGGGGVGGGGGGGGGGTCLTRQHSYSEPPHMHRAAIVRRTASLKPQLPPKPLLLPASSPLRQQGKFNY